MQESRAAQARHSTEWLASDKPKLSKTGRKRYLLRPRPPGTGVFRAFLPVFSVFLSDYLHLVRRMVHPPSSLDLARLFPLCAVLPTFLPTVRSARGRCDFHPTRRPRGRQSPPWGERTGPAENSPSLSLSRGPEISEYPDTVLRHFPIP